MDMSIASTHFAINKKYNINHMNEENFWSKKEPQNTVIKLNLSQNLIYFENVNPDYNQRYLHKINYIRRIMILRKIYKNILDHHNILYIPELQNIILNYVGWHNVYLEKQHIYYIKWIGVESVQQKYDNKKQYESEKN